MFLSQFILITNEPIHYVHDYTHAQSFSTGAVFQSSAERRVTAGPNSSGAEIWPRLGGMGESEDAKGVIHTSPGRCAELV